MGIFSWFKRKSKLGPQPKQKPKKPKYTHLCVNLAGTTCDSDGICRQALIRKIKHGEPPFDNQGALQITLNKTLYKGDPCIECLINKTAIGWIPRSNTEDILYAMSQKGCIVTDLDVVGGNSSDCGRLNCGVKITVRYENCLTI